MEADFYPQYFEVEGKHWWFVGRRAILLRTIDRWTGQSTSGQVLDFGCGTGAMLPYLERYGTVTAVDGDEQAVEFCHMRGRQETIHVPRDDDLPFADNSFDLVTTFDVIEHIKDDVSALAELRRVLRPDGRLIVAVPAFMSLWGDQDEISHHFRRYRWPGLRGVMEDAGLRVLHHSYFNTLLFPPIAALRIIRRAVRGQRADKSDFEIGRPGLNGALSRLLAAEAPLASRVPLPFGVSLLAVAEHAR